MAVRPNVTGSNVILNAGMNHFNGAKLQIRSGSQPDVGGDGAPGSLLAEIDVTTPAFGAAVNRAVSPASAWSGVASAGGTAGWARLILGSAIVDFNVTLAAGGGDLILDSLDIVQNTVVRVTGGTITLPGNDA